ncbi:MAG TPA: ABC-2 family transporter protein [Terriglobia bacterium]|nr:ABC-2 family transporter protein [Terriglobia bacterium]
MKKFLAEFRASWNLIIEYRVMVVIWMLTIVLPLIMLAVWLSIAEKGPVQGYDRPTFISYYLAALIVRNMTGMWFIWEMDSEMRLGTLSFRLLKPMDPLVHYLAYACSSKPLRVLILGPASLIALLFLPELSWNVDALNVLLFVISLAGALMILFLMQYTIGLTGFWITRSLSVNDAWFFTYSLASGYLVPLDLFPPAVRDVLWYLPFRYTMSFPVELLMGRLSVGSILQGIAIQWLWVGGMFALNRWVWRRGLRQFSAVGA